MTTRESTSARVYRFRDLVAFDVEGPSPTDTLYLSAGLARRLGEALLAYADDVDGVRFTDSALGTTTLGDGSCPGCSSTCWEDDPEGGPRFCGSCGLVLGADR